MAKAKLPQPARPATRDGLLLWFIHAFGDELEDHAVLKGGMALRLLDSPRHTNDLDYVFVSYGSKRDIVPLVIVHKWLPAGKRRWREILPGILATLGLWLIAGIIFGRYLADFAFTYSVYYAGLASPMIALVFLYFTASIFLYGGNLNATILKMRSRRKAAAAQTTA